MHDIRKKIDIILHGYMKKPADFQESIFDMEPVLLNDEDDFVENLRMDYEDIVQLLIDLEREFGFQIENTFYWMKHLNLKGLEDLVISSNSEEKSKNRLERMLKYTLEQVPYFQEHVKNDMADTSIKVFPIQTIKQIKDAKSETIFLSKKYEVPYIRGKMLENTIVEAGGEYLKSFNSRWDEAIKMKIEYAYRSKWYGIMPEDKKVSFHYVSYYGNRIQHQQNYTYDKKKKNLSVNGRLVTNFRLKDSYQKIESHNPDWISGEVSLLYILADYMLENGFQLDKVRYIEIINSTTDKNLLKKIQEAFPNANLASAYTFPEIGILAIECSEHKLHLVQENIYLEILGSNDLEVKNSEIGYVTVTALNNYGMPYIRFQNGIKGSVLAKSCKCSDCSPIIDLKLPQDINFICLPEGEILSYQILRNPIEYINCEFDRPIIQFQIIQKTESEFYVYMVVKKQFDNWLEAINKSFVKYADRYISNKLEWHFIYLHELEIGEYTGDLSFFKSEL